MTNIQKRIIDFTFHLNICVTLKEKPLLFRNFIVISLAMLISHSLIGRGPF